MTLIFGGYKKMKKKSLMFILLSLLCLMVFSFNKSYNISNASNSETSIEFEISNGSSGKILIENDSLGVSGSYTKWQDVIDLVYSKVQT